ncbi:MAG: aspartate kinase [Firmicutes bacterium]|nr:aspartate kinase [Bacillota bacterium]
MTKGMAVQKYGGTSLADRVAMLTCAQNIVKTRQQGWDPVVIVSAMGRRGNPYATDTLLDQAFSVNDKPAQRELDMLAACGEVIASVLLALTLQKLDCPAVALNGFQAGIRTNSQFGTAEIIKIDVSRITELTKQRIVPVICGYQGVNANGEITTLGRGGSDISAVAVASALETDTVTIYTDVSAVRTADPKLVAKALPIYSLNYQEVLEMAVEGARVIHPRAVEMAMAKELKIIITSLIETSNHKTEIGPRASVLNGEPRIRAITHISDLTRFIIELTPERVAELLDQAATQGITMDLISLSENQQSFTVKQTAGEKISRMLNTQKLAYTRVDRCSKISLIGTGVRGLAGIMTKVFRTLSDKQIPVLQSSDSYTQIALLIPQDHEREAVNSLHKVLFEEGERND